MSERTCSVAGCERKVLARSWCSTHYKRWWNTGDVNGSRAISKRRPCQIDGCERLHESRGWCGMHYKRWLLTGDVGEVRPRKLYGGATRKYDKGYVMVRGGPNGWVYQHRVVMEQILGRALLPGETVHHINGVRDDNRPENLELWVKPQPAGQRVADLVLFVVEQYPDLVRSVLEMRE